MVTDAGLARLVDVRRFPGSRRHPHVSRAMRNAHTTGYPDMTFTYGNPGDRALSWK